MKIFAISDPHLSRQKIKPMDIFGDHWIDHPLQIARNWDRIVSQEDLVFVPGDVSWALKLQDAIPDLEDLNARPGLKLFTKGNHDLWWPRKKRQYILEGMESMLFLHGRAFRLGPLGIACSRGWTIPGDSWFTDHDQKIYDKELKYMEQALIALGDAEVRVVMMHYPPFNNRLQPGGFVPLFHKYGVTHVVHGHLHGEGCGDHTVRGLKDGISYHLTSCDFVRFEPVEILDLPELDLGPVVVPGGEVRSLPSPVAFIGPQIPAPAEPPTFTVVDG